MSNAEYYLNLIKKEKKENMICVCFGGTILGCFDNTEDGLLEMHLFTFNKYQHLNIFTYYPSEYYLNLIKKEKKENMICVCFGGTILGYFDNTEDGLLEMHLFTFNKYQHSNIFTYYPSLNTSKC